MEDGQFYKVYDGTPQGGIISPTLANIYLHYVLDIWFNNFIRKKCKGEAYIVRYADDFVCCFQYESEANYFYKELKDRLNKYLVSRLGNYFPSPSQNRTCGFPAYGSPHYNSQNIRNTFFQFKNINIYFSLWYIEVLEHYIETSPSVTPFLTSSI